MQAPRILLVDDEPAILASLQKAIAIALPEANVHLALNASDAYAWLRRHAFDVVASDLRLAGDNGLDVLRRAREVDPQGVRILFTAFPEEADARRVVNETRLDHVLAKPFYLREFTDLLRRALDARGSGDANEPPRTSIDASAA